MIFQAHLMCPLGEEKGVQQKKFKYMGAVLDMVRDILSSPSVPGSTSRKFSVMTRIPGHKENNDP